MPLCFLFSGTIFYQSSAGALQAAPVPWSKESDFALPVRIWKKMMDQHYAGQALLRLDKEIFDQLRSFKNRMGYLSFEQAISELLEMAQERVPG